MGLAVDLDGMHLSSPASIRFSVGRCLFARLLPIEISVSLLVEVATMPLFEIETNAHIIIVWADDESKANDVVKDAYPDEQVVRMTKRPRNAWVISKSVLGLTDGASPCDVARDCLAKSSGDKLHAIRLYMQETGADLTEARKAVESNMVMGW